ncbi:MAG: tRNA epoxyqueuosine(34) reductase QueG [Chlorobiaceae bacterium]
MPQNSPGLALQIRKEASRLGFAAVGFSVPSPQPLAMERYRAMIAGKRHAEMAWMEERMDERSDPVRLLPGLKTVISAAISYNHPAGSPAESLRISRYALVADYHEVLHRKLNELVEAIQVIAGKQIDTLIAVDSAPVLEKSWAERACIGKTGKNTLLIIPSAGSRVFLGEILTDLEITEERTPLPNLCGSCSLCIEHCPTGALVGPGVLDARRCISALTVELKRAFTDEEEKMTGNWIFGCDICQELCPHNQQALIQASGSFPVNEKLMNLPAETLLGLTRSGFRELFKGTPIYRIGLRRLKRNVQAALKNLKKSKNQQPR